MKMRNYLKKKEDENKLEALEKETLTSVVSRVTLLRKSALFLLGTLLLALPLGFVLKGQKEVKPIELTEAPAIELVEAPIAATVSKRGTLTIPVGTVKANPFLPYRDLGMDSSTDVPAFTLVEPPEALGDTSAAARVMDTVVSGILYDRYSPSAILNIEGNDYLVKKGDVVNNYKVLAIAQDSVSVQLGENTYKAGIGEILTEGTLNHNDVSNLNNKFGGAR